ncbi:hypothetical protein QR680_004582 [Steinernema hermaphroditum]|uniref:Transmembrane protein 65 n=1 Tax=Steinernema hermaphroditum TaxID=289476 RepID=A0AA39LTX0_9BILA|nr:hypothetical protein QR680_004582 [Steinernema hermaphroditum]
MALWSRMLSESLIRTVRPCAAEFPRLVDHGHNHNLLPSSDLIKASINVEERRTMFSTPVSHFEIVDTASAKSFVENLMPGERNLLYAVLRKKRVEQYYEEERLSTAEVNHDDLVAIWWINYIPFMVYGCLDNVVMIVAGETFDKAVGFYMGISIMAAAAIGNIASNVMGIGMVHYVEIVVRHFGIKNPYLNVKQMNAWSVRMITYLSRIVGLVCGCVLGMMPLLFYDSPLRSKAHEAEAAENDNGNVELDSTRASDHLRTATKTASSEYEQFHAAWKEVTRNDDIQNIGMSMECDD